MKNILVCVSGLTPQVITETLYCLSVQKKIKIDELYIITTSRGRDVILGLDEEINKKKNVPPLMNEISKMCKKYRKITNPAFNLKHIIVATELSIELKDIRNDLHNKLFPNTLCGFINQITKDKNNILHCSISGGRKSMSVDMAFALSLFGRENDKLWHVLTHENQEFKHFFPENKNQEKDLELADIPYVKLSSIMRNIVGSENKNESFRIMSYLDLVEFTQKELYKMSADKLYINVSRREMWYGKNDIINIEPKQINLYKYFIDNNSSIDNPIKIDALKKHFSIDKRTGENILRYDETNIRSLITKLNKDKIHFAILDAEIEKIFKIKSGKYGSSEYFLNATSSNVIFIE